MEDEFRSLTAWAKKQTLFAYSEIMEEKMRLLKVVNLLIELIANNTTYYSKQSNSKNLKKV